MTTKDFAAALNGNQYRREGSPELFAQMKAAGLVAVFGASDDLIEFRGAIYDEDGAYEGGEYYITKDGLLKNECDNDDCPHFARMQERAALIEADWAKDGYSWVYRTDIPHETFVIKEDDEPYCRGIVFALADVRPREPQK